MPRNGCLVLTDMQDAKLRLLCEKCGLRRQYDIQALINKIGNVAIPDLVNELAKRNGCEEFQPHNIGRRCSLRAKRADDPAWVASAPQA